MNNFIDYIINTLFLLSIFGIVWCRKVFLICGIGWFVQCKVFLCVAWYQMAYSLVHGVFLCCVGLVSLQCKLSIMLCMYVQCKLFFLYVNCVGCLVQTSLLVIYFYVIVLHQNCRLMSQTICLVYMTTTKVLIKMSMLTGLSIMIQELLQGNDGV